MGKGDDAVSHIHIGMMIQRVIFCEVRPHKPIAQRLAAENGIAFCVGRDGDGIQQQGGGFVQIRLPVGSVRIVHGGAVEERTVPVVGFGLVSAAVAIDRRHGFVVFQDPVRLKKIHLAERIFVLIRQIRFKRQLSLNHPFQSQSGDPGSAPRIAAGCLAPAGNMAVKIVTEKRQRQIQQFLFVKGDLLLRGGKHRQRSRHIEIALDRPVSGFSGAVIHQAVSGMPDLFFQIIIKRDHPFKIDGFIHHKKLLFSVRLDLQMKKYSTPPPYLQIYFREIKGIPVDFPGGCCIVKKIQPRSKT